MKHSTKVKKFAACIKATKTAYDARMMAFRKYDLNASAPDDESAWWEAVEACGNPYAS